jgi:DNA-binding protein HU-beta
MNKQSIIEKVHGVLGGTKADAERAVDAMIEAITDGLKKGDEVSIAGLGIFSTKMRPARQGRNPRTGEPVVSHGSVRTDYRVTTGTNRGQMSHVREHLRALAADKLG